MASESSGIGRSQFSYELFSRKLGFGFGRVVNWRHDATNLIASDHSRACLQGNSGAPVTRLSLVGNYRIVGDVGHYGPPLRQTRACDAAMSTAARAQCRASLAHAFSRRGRHHRSGERSGHGRGAQGDVSVRPSTLRVRALIGRQTATSRSLSVCRTGSALSSRDPESSLSKASG
jgi:hypothetical protein